MTTIRGLYVSTCTFHRFPEYLGHLLFPLYLCSVNFWYHQANFVIGMGIWKEPHSHDLPFWLFYVKTVCVSVVRNVHVVYVCACVCACVFMCVCVCVCLCIACMSGCCNIVKRRNSRTELQQCFSARRTCCQSTKFLIQMYR